MQCAAGTDCIKEYVHQEALSPIHILNLNVTTLVCLLRSFYCCKSKITSEVSLNTSAVWKAGVHLSLNKGPTQIHAYFSRANHSFSKSDFPNSLCLSVLVVVRSVYTGEGALLICRMWEEVNRVGHGPCHMKCFFNRLGRNKLRNWRSNLEQTTRNGKNLFRSWD